MTIEDHARVAPEWLTVEQALLGAVLVGGAFRDVESMVGAGDFQRPAHGLVWTAMRVVADRGNVVEPVAVMTALGSAGDLRSAGGVEYLHELVAGVFTGANAVTYAAQVQEMASARRLVEIADWIKTRVDLRANTRDVETDLRARLANVHPNASQAAKHVSELMDDFLNELETPTDPDKFKGLSWPYRDVNDVVRPMRTGQLLIVGARPGVGKTLACLDVARHVAVRLEKPVVFHSLEMGVDEVMNRMICAETRIPLERMNVKALTMKDWETIGKMRARVEDAPLWIDERTDIGVSDVRSSIRTNSAALAIVDYLGLMKMPRANEASNRQQDVAAVSRQLKITAKEEGIPILVAHQLNRSSTSRADKRPEISDLRESGALEQDADLVVLLHREDMYEPESVRAGEVDWIVAKQRAGRMQTVALAALLHQARFDDLG